MWARQSADIKIEQLRSGTAAMDMAALRTVACPQLGSDEPEACCLSELSDHPGSTHFATAVLLVLTERYAAGRKNWQMAGLRQNLQGVGTALIAHR